MSNTVSGGSVKEQLLSYRKTMDRMYYVSTAILLGYNIFGSSVMSHYFFEWLYGLFGNLPGDLVTLIVETICMVRYLIIFPALYNIAVEVSDRRKKILMAGLLLLGWFYSFYWRQFSSMVFFEITAVMVASYGKDFKKVGIQSILISLVIISVSFVLSIAGILPDFVKMRGDMARHAFGMQYCTDLAAHWCFLLLTYMFIKDGKQGWLFYVAVGILSVLNILLVDGRNSLIIVLLACIGSVVYRSFSKKELHLPKGIGKVFSWILALSYVLLAGVYMALNFAYSRELVSVLEKIPGFAASIVPRLATSRRATMVFPFSLFGSPYIQVGDGGGTADYLGIYTFLDDSYVSVYVLYGIVGLLLMLATSTYAQFRLKKEGQLFRMFLLALVALDCFVEHHWTETGYNVFLFLPFAVITAKAESEKEKRKDVDK